MRFEWLERDFAGPSPRSGASPLRGRAQTLSFGEREKNEASTERCPPAQFVTRSHSRQKTPAFFSTSIAPLALSLESRGIWIFRSFVCSALRQAQGLGKGLEPLGELWALTLSKRQAKRVETALFCG
jgi:hypothetical protein